jgi:two-component system phosphate regulon sensor histidine kinase PhoR
MRTAMVLLVGAAISFTPVLALLVLILTGVAVPWPTLAAILIVILASFGLALVWMRDISVALDVVRQFILGGGQRSPSTTGKPFLPPMAGLARDIDRLFHTHLGHTALLQQQLQAGREILERLPDPLIVLGSDRSVWYINVAAQTIFGTEIASVLRHPEIRGAIDRTLAEGTAQTAGLSLPVPVAREVQAIAIGLEPPLDDGGRILLVLSDRTREWAVERMRADFVANASHELRTPLASLIGFIDTLRGPAADDAAAQQRFLAIMAEQTTRMHRLIDHLLRLSRIELTEHQIPTEWIDLAALTQHIAAEFEPEIAARGAVLQLALDPRLTEILGDADQLAQVLLNLLDNALRYGKPGGCVRLTAGLAQPEGQWPPRPGVVLSVADDGPGIPRAHIPRLTERFYRVDRGRSRAAGGTGLGLAIVKHIVNRHRGQLRIESTEGKGATFSIWLPVTASEGHRSSASGATLDKNDSE